MDLRTSNILEKHTILRCIVGSKACGLDTPESDQDEMGVCIEDLQDVVGFDPFEQVVLSKHEGHELDLSVYSLRKFLKLTLTGNPNLMNLLFTPPELCLTRTFIGAQLQALAPKIVNRRAGRAFLGYLEMQRQRLTGERGQKNVNRSDLIIKYGFDTKYAMHMLRLGFQGIELLETGKLSLPLPDAQRSFLMAVRNGEESLATCLDTCKDLEQRLKNLLTMSYLPEEPDREFVELWMVATYFQQWKGRIS